MKRIKRYTTPSGKERFKFAISAGVDQATGKSIMVRRQGFKTGKEAKHALADVLKAIAAGTYTPLSEKRLTYKEFYEEVFLPQYRREVRGSTYSLFRIHIEKHVLPVIGKVYLDKLSVFRCQQLVNRLADQMMSYKEVITHASMVVEKAVQLEMLPKNPFKKVTLPRKKISTKKESNFYTKEELDKFLTTAEKTEGLNHFALLQLLADTGMRKGEALALTWGDVDLDGSTVQINKTRSHDANRKPTTNQPKTAAGNRAVYLLPKTVQVLKTYKEQQTTYFGTSGNKDRLFTCSAPTVNRLVSRVSKKAGLHKITVHGLRHTNASMLADARLTAAQIQKRLGHEDYQTTMSFYTHVSDESNKAGTEQLEEWLQNSKGKPSKF